MDGSQQMDASRDANRPMPETGPMPDGSQRVDAEIDAALDGGTSDAALDATADGMIDAALDAAADGMIDAALDATADGMIDAGGPFACIDETCAGLVLISEVRTRGPGGASDEYVEIYNASGVAVDIQDMELRYISSNGTGSQRAQITTSTVLPSGGFFLFANADYAGASDLEYTTGLADDGGSLSLRVGGKHYVDRFGWGTAQFQNTEGGAFAPEAAPCTVSCERKAYATSGAAEMEVGGAHAESGNAHDTNSNADDFIQRSAGDPQTSASTPEHP